ncbi:hypothetical protein BHE74_00043425 [Ensete ventricosum]|nr:hypothetical protein BHE74_00043425 [Ensete ventricosum]
MRLRCRGDQNDNGAHLVWTGWSNPCARPSDGDQTAEARRDTADKRGGPSRLPRSLNLPCDTLGPADPGSHNTGRRRMDITEVTIVHHAALVLLLLWVLVQLGKGHPVLFFVALLYLYKVRRRPRNLTVGCA